LLAPCERGGGARGKPAFSRCKPIFNTNPRLRSNVRPNSRVADLKKRESLSHHAQPAWGRGVFPARGHFRGARNASGEGGEKKRFGGTLGTTGGVCPLEEGSFAGRRLPEGGCFFFMISRSLLLRLTGALPLQGARERGRFLEKRGKVLEKKKRGGGAFHLG